MESKLKLKLKPFTVPNFVLVEENDAIPPGMSSIAISYLEPEALVALCEQFRRDVFDRAKLRDPDRIYGGQAC